jgi:O-antigen biosynthesis protein WbqP
MMPKFRSMYIDTPAEVPTHLLNDPDRWITPVGRIYRKLSIDELPQFWSIFIGKMSIIGPRPALWNQFDLVAERDKYGANDVRPGLTGWAQINGRDELAIPVKAKLDGEYVEKLSFLFDCKCFFSTILAVLRRDGVVEGDTDSMKKEKKHVKK